MERLMRCQKLAKTHGCTVAQTAMSYLFSNRMNVFAVVSTGSPDRMKEIIRASNLRLREEEVNFLENGFF